MIYNTDNLKIVRTNLKASERESVLFLMKHFNQDTPQSLFRFLISKERGEIKEVEARYKKGDSKETIAEKTSRLKSMSDEELTNYFYNIGIFKDGPMKDMPETTISYKIGFAKDIKERAEIVIYTTKNLNKPIINKELLSEEDAEIAEFTQTTKQYIPVENTGRTLDEIINEVVKSKLI